MARLRTLKPGFFANAELAELPFSARLLFAGLWTIADREGRLPDRPKFIKGQLFPYDAVPINDLLSRLDAGGFIQRYAVAGARYIQVTTFKRHQNPHVKEAPSTIPPPPEYRTSTVSAPDENGASPVSAPEMHPTSRADIGEWGVGGGEGDTPQEETEDAVHALAPGGARTRAGPSKNSFGNGAHRAMVAALAERFGQPANRSEGGRLGKAAQQLLEAGATPDEVTTLAEACLARWGPTACTPTALASNVTVLRAPAGRERYFSDHRSAAQKAVEPQREWRESNWREPEEVTP